VGLIGIIGAAVLLGYGGWEAARSVFRQPSGWPLTLAASILAWAWLTVGLQALGTVGLLNPTALLVHCAFGAGLAAVVRLRAGGVKKSPRITIDWNITAILALGFFLAPCVLLGGLSVLGPPKIVSDGPIYHLFFAANWWKAGRIYMIASPFGGERSDVLPANGDLFFTALMALYGGERRQELARLHSC